ncbi:subtilisin family serine protease [Hydrogenispora ethanolica]|uniref:Subtilisin family serine protease n=1 Tax=Hydrogenispora ethanolica TaxID=1082276 RepID=A0A4V2QDK5_HYDET|nr:S8 family serine peptidase [Hydrogenispora ethanolica]TCL64707.1 subtilisin family serine protease [Hydrogenispora ethanolica]
MRFTLKKTSLKYLVTLSATMVLVFSSIAMANSKATTAVSNEGTIIVQDGQSGAVIFERNGTYYFGYTNSQQLVNHGEIRPKEILVKYKKPDPGKNRLTVQGMESVQETVKKYSGSTRQINDQLRLALVKVPQDKDYFQTMQELKKNSVVEYAEPNYVLRAQAAPNDPYYARQWGPQTIHAEAAWSKIDATKRAGVTIAILDTGINAMHEDLQSSIVSGFNVVNNNNNTNDGMGHGSHVAGIAAAAVNNGKGIAGIAGGSKIMPVKVLGENGSGDLSTIINGIKYATDHGAQVISMSLGGAGSSQALQDAVNYAINRGVSVVAASGNENGPVDLPGNCKGVITVGAIDRTGMRASYSNYGPEMDVIAPGSDIMSSYIGGASSYTTMSGTSMATPFVAGVVALVRAANPNLTPDEVTAIIQQSATDKGRAGFDNEYGYGVVDAEQAVNLALKGNGNSSPAPVPTPNPTPAPSPAPQPSINLALNKTAIASSVESQTRNAAKAFDGTTATRWASREGIDPQWIRVDLGKTSTIGKVVLKWETAYAKSYKIQVSNDAIHWATVYSTTSGTGGTTTLTGSAIGRYVRMYGIQRGTPYGYSLREFEIYGK